MKTYGSYAHVPKDKSPAGKPLLVIKADPHVMARLKRWFPRVLQQRTGVLILADTLEVCRDLATFIERFSLDADEATALHVKLRAEEHRSKAELVLEILGGCAPQHTEWMTPALQPRPYQEIAAGMIHATHRLLLADDLGLGKTLSGALTLCDPAALPAVVITETHLPGQWQRELARFFPHLTTHIVTSGQPYDPLKVMVGRGRKSRPLHDRMPDVLILTWSKIGGWGDWLHGKYNTWIMDEAQALRHHDTVRYAGVARGIEDATYKVLLTATPVYNYGDEIYNLISIMDPDALGDRSEFKREWCDDGGKVSDPRALGAYLRDEGLMLRRTAAEVGRELPGLIRVEQNVDSDPRVLKQMMGDTVGMAQLILDKTRPHLDRGSASMQLEQQMRQATGVAKAPFVAEFVRLLLETEKKVVVWAWHRECFAPGTKVLMYDGTAKNVEDVRVGDEVMGPDSKPRTVKSLVGGTGPTYQVVPNKGEPWVCSAGHILAVHNTRSGPETCTVERFVKESERWQQRRVLYRADTVHFPEREPVVEPWLMGFWLGDGSSHLGDLRVASVDPEVATEMEHIAERHGLVVKTWAAPGFTGVSQCKHLALSAGVLGCKSRNTLREHFVAMGLHHNKHIPDQYLRASAPERRELLAGLIDSDGHVYRGNAVGTADFTTTSRVLADGVAFVARSLGLAAYIHEKTVSGSGRRLGGSGRYLSVSISGDLTQLPMRIMRKKAEARAGQKNVLRTGFRVEPAGIGDYYGFEVDGDHLFLLADFTVVHNCYKILAERLADFWPAMYTGTENGEEKERGVNRFKDPESPCRVLFMSVRSGAGLDGLQFGCHVGVFAELDWSPKVHHQAEGRLARDGQEEKVLVYYMVSDQGADPTMMEVLEAKLQQSEPLINPDQDVFEVVGVSEENRSALLAAAVLRRAGVEVPSP